MNPPSGRVAGADHGQGAGGSIDGVSISIVIPSWNGAELLSKHLPSVMRAAAATGDAGACEVVVSDDGSTDGTRAMLACDFPQIRVVCRARNGGFSHAANDGVAASRGAIVILLNNDMEVRTEAFALLAGALVSDAGLFAVVPSIVRAASGAEEAITRLEFRHGVVSTSLAAAGSAAAGDQAGEGGSNDPAYACGGAMAVRRHEFMALGGFDPLYAPFYWEDVDLSYRARKRGRRIGFVPAARVDHDHGATIGARFDRAGVLRTYERNRLIFTWKNLTGSGAWRRHLATLPAKAAWGVLANRAFVGGLRDALALRREILEARAVEERESTRGDEELLRS